MRACLATELNINIKILMVLDPTTVASKFGTLTLSSVYQSVPWTGYAGICDLANDLTHPCINIHFVYIRTLLLNKDDN